MKRKENHKNYFLILAIPLLIITFMLSLVFSREEIHIWINRHHYSFLDILMRAWTLLGDGLWVLILVIPFLFCRMRYFLIVFTGYAISGISAQIFKRIFFDGMPRPVKYFSLHGIDYDLYLVPGVQIHSWHSFPSGHTATAFGVFLGISLILKKKWLQIVCFLLAVGVGYSRMYLSEHFLIDVAGGALLGIVSGYLSYWWLNRYRGNWLENPVYKIVSR